MAPTKKAKVVEPVNTLSNDPNAIRKKHLTPGGRRLGWKPDLPDRRDHKYSLWHSTSVHLPTKISLRDQFPYRFDQEPYSSCTANSGCYLMGALKGVKSLDEAYSRLFYYYNERALEDSIKEDSGASVRDGIKLLASKGVPLEKHWPYISENFAKAPTKQVVVEAMQTRPTTYMRLETRWDFKQCLAKGHGFTIGITCYESIDSEQLTNTGIMLIPKETERTVGGHAITVIGYDDDFWNNKVFKASKYTQEECPNHMYEVLNSWGLSWADNGCFWIPQEYIENPDLSNDAWTIRI